MINTKAYDIYEAYENIPKNHKAYFYLKWILDNYGEHHELDKLHMGTLYEDVAKAFNIPVPSSIERCIRHTKEKIGYKEMGNKAFVIELLLAQQLQKPLST